MHFTLHKEKGLYPVIFVVRVDVSLGGEGSCRDAANILIIPKVQERSVCSFLSL